MDFLTHEASGDGIENAAALTAGGAAGAVPDRAGRARAGADTDATPALIGGVMSNTPPITRHQGEETPGGNSGEGNPPPNRWTYPVIEDTADMSLWIDWKDFTKNEEIFSVLLREAQGKDNVTSATESMDASPESPAPEEDACAMTSATGQFRFEDEQRYRGEVQEYNIPGLVDFGGLVLIMQPHGIGGKKRGKVYFPYVLKGEDIVLQLRAGKSKTIPNGFVEFKSAALHRNGGLTPCYQRLRAALETMSGRIEKRILSRVDPCQDVAGIMLSAFADRLRQKRYITRAQVTGEFVIGDDLIEMFSDRAGDTGFTKGRNTKLRVYDKKRKAENDPVEMEVLREFYGGTWPDAVTRIEFQLRRETLKLFCLRDADNPRQFEEFRIDTEEDWDAHKASIWANLTWEWFRMTEETVDRKNRNQGRAAAWEVWAWARDEARKSMGGDVRPVTRERRMGPVDFKQLGVQEVSLGVKRLVWRDFDSQVTPERLALALNERAQALLAVGKLAKIEMRHRADYLERVRHGAKRKIEGAKAG